MQAASKNFSAERAELQALLDSGIFGRSPNLQKFLVFVCEKYFAGEVDEIKEYLVAVEALGRPADFDQKRDSIVRVEAHRLRKRLDKYYRGMGAARPLRILLASGNYVPQFVPNTETDSDSEVEPAGVAEKLPFAESVLENESVSASRTTNVSEEIVPAEGLAVPGVAASPWRVSKFVVILVCFLAAAIGYGVPWWPRVGLESQSTVGDVGNPSPVVADFAADASTGPTSDADHRQAVRILAGSPFSSFVDRFGHTWTGDAYFQGGVGAESKVDGLHYTALPELYQYRREGEFSYAIPLAPQTYELRLHFAEPIFGEENLAGGGETSRLFEVFLNGESLLRQFDILADGFGARNANVKVFKDIRPAKDGRLHLDFRPGMHEVPLLSAIEAIPSEPGKIHPIRVVASERGFTDHAGNYWSADHYVYGGRFARRNPVSHPDFDSNLFQGERYGNFTYMIPVATNGRYRLRLYFCERWWGPQTHAGGGKGNRRFDVFLNGRELLPDFDVYQEAGGADKPIMREFAGIVPNSQGKLILQFIPRRNYAMVNAVEVLDENP